MEENSGVVLMETKERNKEKERAKPNPQSLCLPLSPIKLLLLVVVVFFGDKKRREEKRITALRC